MQHTRKLASDRAASATAVSLDALAPAPAMSKVMTAWFTMAGDMMKLQQQWLTSVLSAGDTHDRHHERLTTTSA